MGKSLKIAVKPENSFRSIAKGWKEAERSISTIKLDELRKDIMDAIGSRYASAFYRRLRGESEISYAETLKVKKVFEKYGIRDPYGCD